MIVLGWLAWLITTPVFAAEPASEQRLDEVAERGAHVMPFDLEKTVHIFSKTDTGGIQQVIAKDKADSKQISLIRLHLSQIAEEFQRGDLLQSRKHSRCHDARADGIESGAYRKNKRSFLLKFTIRKPDV
ncbi:MAG: hypothetical protein Q8K47_01175 [Nitrosomonas sp.]|nr:hypothetical protein [Nitrosomonas sp.]